MTEMNLDIATAPWHGSCQDCHRELGMPAPELVAAPPGTYEWRCVPCLTEIVRGNMIRASDTILGKR